MKIICHLLLAFTVLALAARVVSTSDPGPLQDFCIATHDPKDKVFVNGKFCKDPKKVTSKDFVYSGLHIPRDTNNTFGYTPTMVNVDSFPGINTLGVSMARVDFAPKGLNPPHYHPRGSETFLLVKGKLLSGLVTSNADGNRHFTRVMNPGDVVAYPQGLTHYQLNLGNKPAFAYVAFGCQKVGVVTVSTSLFKADPRIEPQVLAKAFMLDKREVWRLQEKFENV